MQGSGVAVRARWVIAVGIFATIQKVANNFSVAILGRKRECQVALVGI